MAGLGAANLAAGFLQGFPISSRSSIELCFAEMKDRVMDKLRRFGLFARLGEPAFFPTIGGDVSAYLKSRPIERVDWEDRASRRRHEPRDSFGGADNVDAGDGGD